MFLFHLLQGETDETLETKKQQKTSNNKNPEHRKVLGVYFIEVVG